AADFLVDLAVQISGPAHTVESCAGHIWLPAVSARVEPPADAFEGECGFDHALARQRADGDEWPFSFFTLRVVGRRAAADIDDFRAQWLEADTKHVDRSPLRAEEINVTVLGYGDETPRKRDAL